MLEITLLGEIVIRVDGQPLTQFRSQTEIALLAYLAHTGQTHGRESVADLLWEARSTSQSLSNLRTTLARLRKRVGDGLVVSRKTVAIDTAVHTQTDTARLQTRLTHAQQDPTAVHLLAEGLALYRGEFMSGFSLPQAPRFNDWLIIEQERLRQIAMRGYRQLAQWQEGQGAFTAGVITARQWVAWDPLDEMAQQMLMRLLAYDGRRAEALAVYEKCRHLFAAELGTSPAPATTALYHKIQGDNLPRPRLLPTAVHNLPRALSPLFGRQKEIDALTQTLLDPAYPLVSVTGVGGIGKTSVALAAGRELVAQQSPVFQDGVWFVSLEEAGMDTAVDVPEKVAALVGQALRLSFHNQGPLWPQLLGQLARQKLLLIFDNIEQFLPLASDLIMTLLEAGPHIQLLVTSRTTLALAATVAFPLTGLPIPADASAEALHNDSVRLFAARAAKMPAPFQLEKHLAEVVAICQFVDGLPLAVELAAASLGRLLMGEILPALTSNLHLLNSTRHDLPPRQRTLQAVFEHTWQLLDGREKTLLAQIAIFRGGFTRQAAEAVLAGSQAGLYSLQYHALLTRDETGRFRLHPLIRQLAVARGEREMDTAVAQAAHHHSHYYLHLFSQQTLPLRRGAPHPLMTSLQLEQNNLQLAWEYAIQHAEWADMAPSVEAVQHFYHQSGLFQDGLAQLHLAQQALSLSTADPATLPPSLKADLYQAEAALWQPISQFEAALTALHHALAQECIHPLTKINAHLVWGLVLDSKGDYPGSLAQHQTASDLLAGTDEWLLWTRSQQGIGWALIQLGQIEAASAPLQQALDFAQRADDTFGQMMTLTFLGVQARRRNQHALAQQCYEQALALAQALGERLTEGKLLSNLGVLSSMRFRLSDAQRYLAQALAIFEQINVPRNHSITSGDLGVVHMRLGNYAEAQPLLEQSLALARQIEDRYGEAWALIWLSRVRLVQGQAAEALALAQAGRDLAEELGVRPLQVDGLARMGQALLVLAEGDEAKLQDTAVCYQQAYDLSQAINQPNTTLGLLANLAEVALRQEKQAIALGHCETILALLDATPSLREGVDLYIYWVLFQVLKAGGDARSAGVLAEGQRLLAERAAGIEDTAVRQSFLEGIASHRQLSCLSTT